MADESNPPGAGAGVRYTADFLLFLRGSPLCVTPAGLPPAEEWMGPPPEAIRNQAKPPTERTKTADAALLEQRRPGLDRATSRNSANPDDIILGPPRTSFASATSMRGNRLGDSDKPSREGEPRFEKFTFRNPRVTNADAEHERVKTNNAFRRRGDTDQDSEGWSTVKPRKSFGLEGAERFHGRMGGSDRTTGPQDRRLRERDERDNAERRQRNTDQGLREKDGEEADGSRWNGLNRNLREPRHKETSEGTPLTQRERIDRQKSWRDRIPDERPFERHGDRPNDRAHDRRWDREREHRVERDPEWLDEPVEEKSEKSQGKTQEDFQKFLEEMKRGNKKTGEKPATEPSNAEIVEAGGKPVSAVSDVGSDRFFAAFGKGASLDLGSPSAELQEPARPKTGKSSRFTSFFSAQDNTRGPAEPPVPAAAAPAVASPNGTNQAVQRDDGEKEAFAVLLQKLQSQGLNLSSPSTQPQPAPGFSEQSAMSAMTPGLGSQPTPTLTPGLHSGVQHPSNPITSPGFYQQYGRERRDDSRQPGLPQPQILQDILTSPPMPQPQQAPKLPRPDQNPQDIFPQRQPGIGQASGRGDQNPAPIHNQNAEFLMRLMQNARGAPEPLRTEQLMVRMPQPTKQVNPPHVQEREPEYHREPRVASKPQPQPQPQRQLRPQGAPGFFDDQFQTQDSDSRPQQPTQILQRPPPPGLDHLLQFHMGGAPPMAPPRPMIPPPPGINPPARSNGPPGQAIFPPNFPPGAFPPPDSMMGPLGPPGTLPGPPRNMPGPPGFFGGMPPPGLGGFMPPPPNMGGFQGPPPDGGPPFGGPPFDGRNMPPHGAGGAYRRQ